jgi:hypothetical protein
MAIRGFGFQTLTGTAQPAFGTTLTAVVLPSPDMYTGDTAPRSNKSIATITVANPNIWRKGDRVIVAPLATFEVGNTAPQDVAQVQAINTGASTLTVMGLTAAHAAGEFVVLAIQAARIRIRANADELYIGEDSTVSPTAFTLVDFCLPGADYDIGQSSVGNVYGTAHYWVSGTAADTFLPSITTI